MKSFKLIKTQHYPEFDLKVTLKPCFRCNHNCWFCEEYDNASPVWTKDDCDFVIEKLKDIPKDKKKIFFYFYGGEPTLSKYWEYLNYKILEDFNDRELFIQTQTNLSIDKDRLKQFCKNVEGQPVDICSSYHMGKQKVKDFIEKMHICNEYGVLGLCFFSTEIPKEEQFIHEFNTIAAEFPNKLKVKFTEIDSLVDRRDIKGYEHLFDHKQLVGTDRGKSMEYRYFTTAYPELTDYFEEGWNFECDDEVKNYSTVKAENIHKQFKYWKCDCGTKHAVIDHTLTVYHCNDFCYKDTLPTKLDEIDFSEYFNKSQRCLVNACYDGLDHAKYK